MAENNTDLMQKLMYISEMLKKIQVRKTQSDLHPDT
jgi:hypothetical protein